VTTEVARALPIPLAIGGAVLWLAIGIPVGIGRRPGPAGIRVVRPPDLAVDRDRTVDRRRPHPADAGSLLDVLAEDYLRTARAKGLSRGRVLSRHGVRSAVGVIVPQFAGQPELSGAISSAESDENGSVAAYCAVVVALGAPGGAGGQFLAVVSR
jgi:hypothetical protein